MMKKVRMGFNIVLIIGLLVLATSGLLFGLNFNSPSALGAIGRVFGGLLLLPGGVLTFDGVAKGRTLYIFSKKNGEEKLVFWHCDDKEENNESKNGR